MEILKLQTNEINQNGYHKNNLTRDKIGALFIFPNGYIPEDCLSCDGYVLKIEDYLKLYCVLGKDFNSGAEATDEFRIPDYNVTQRFLQPSQNNFGKQIAAGLPNIWGEFGCYQDGYVGGGYVANGAFYAANGWAWSKASAGDAGNRSIIYGYNASRCSSIFGNSSTVQPPSQFVHICIKYK